MTQTSFSKRQALYIYEINEPSFDGHENINESSALFEKQKKAAQYSFKLIKEYLRSCEAYQDLNTRVIIDDNAIYFGHSLAEISLSFPKLASLIFMDSNILLTEENILFYLEHISSSGMIRIVNRSIVEQQKELILAAKQYFSTKSSRETRSVDGAILQAPTPEIFLQTIFANYQILTIGEQYEHQASKKFLIENMGVLQKQGVKRIFLEHVLYDTQKQMFDAYFESNSLALPRMLQDYLQHLDESFNLTKPQSYAPYGYTALVIQAKRYGIRIMPIETIVSYNLLDEKNRSLMMHYLVARRFEEIGHHEKAVFFMGSLHINAFNDDVPGIKEITDSLTLVVEDYPTASINLEDTLSITKPDLHIYLDATLSSEALELNNLYAIALEEAEIDRAILVERASELLPNSFSQKNRFFTEHLKNPKHLVTQALGVIVGVIVAETYYGRPAVLGFISAQVLSILVLYLLDSLKTEAQIKYKPA